MRPACAARALVVGGVLCVLPFLSSPAQRIERPVLRGGVDLNDWAAYYDYGVANLRNDPRAAEAAFAWASALDPSRPEPIYASWIAFWARDPDKFRKYLRDDDDVLRDPSVVHADSLRAKALRRNPFVHQGLVVLLYDLLPGRWPDDIATRGWIAYGNGDLPIALELFGRAVEREPKKYGYLRYNRASAFVNLVQLDSASAEIASILTQLRSEDSAKVGRGYQSKELLEYAQGLLQLQMRHASASREAFTRSLLENPGFVPAHQMIADFAVAAHDSATALLEYSTAVEIDPNDVVVRLGFAKALLAASRPADAVVQLQRAVSLAPEYAAAYYRLGMALETAGDTIHAEAAYTQFLARATRADPARAQAEQRVESLRTARQP